MKKARKLLPTRNGLQINKKWFESGKDSTYLFMAKGDTFKLTVSPKEDGSVDTWLISAYESEGIRMNLGGVTFTNLGISTLRYVAGIRISILIRYGDIEWLRADLGNKSATAFCMNCHQTLYKDVAGSYYNIPLTDQKHANAYFCVKSKVQTTDPHVPYKH